MDRLLLINPIDKSVVKSLEERIKRVGVGNYHVIVVTEDNRVFVTGDNSLGQLGTGDTSERKQFTPVHSQSLKNKNIVNVCCGEFFTALATDDNELFCCGSSPCGQEEDYLTEFTQIQFSGGKIDAIRGVGSRLFIVTNAVDDWRDLWAVGHKNEEDDEFKSLSQLQWKSSDVSGNKIRQISCGDYHTTIVTSSSDKGELLVAGSNSRGQLCIGRQIDTIVSSFVVATVPKTLVVKKADCGSFHTTILSESGEIFSAGDNDYNQLLLGEKVSATPTLTQAAVKLPTIDDIFCSTYATFLLSDQRLLMSSKEEQEGYTVVPLTISYDESLALATTVLDPELDDPLVLSLIKKDIAPDAAHVRVFMVEQKNQIDELQQRIQALEQELSRAKKLTIHLLDPSAEQSCVSCGLITDTCCNLCHGKPALHDGACNVRYHNPLHHIVIEQ